MNKILLVDDDLELTQLLTEILTLEGFQVTVAEDGEEGLQRLGEQPFDLVLLDVMMPRLNGFAMLTRLRKTHDTPVLMLTARGDSQDRVNGLEAGADDYLAKPFDLDELLARVRALLRRDGTTKIPVLLAGAVELDTLTHTCRLNGQTVMLAAKEEQLLEYLLRNQGRIVPREELEEHLWDARTSLWSDTLRTHVRYLRAKVDTDPKHPLITTARGLGYGIVHAPPDKGDRYEQ